MIDFSQSHFTLFSLPSQFAVDAKQLDARYRELVALYHPDKFATASDAERRASLQAATHINEAYQTLKSALPRARYLLQLAGVDTQEETNTSMPMDFLMAQMEWRESIGDAKASKNVDALENLAREMRAEMQALEDKLATQIDAQQDFANAAMSVRKLRFMEKLDQEIGDAIEAVLY
ncbi:Fe-S protein assembly co-chaperone HscB [Chitinibacter fontanus]|uniref:Co-chaperone protein HscB homolog n=1 Tax=Chitinibacter fontanus TaxID=1737446 RepID=A0A7D5VAT4_9NEIS|nr:Fe-S protein assembly co-chaperone HscB [Chitinibacter fontanus]QLI82335.1 Fe-S protein assembly co-chaperone HscB [Chitinibacter fontanus]